MNNANKWTTEKYQELIGMWLRGVETDEICRHFKIAVTGLNKAINRLRANGVPLPLRKSGHKAGRHNAPWTQEEVETLIRMRNEKRPTSEISETLDRSFYSVQGMISRLHNEDIPVVKLGSGMRRLWDADRLRQSIAGRGLIVIDSKKAA